MNAAACRPASGLARRLPLLAGALIAGWAASSGCAANAGPRLVPPDAAALAAAGSARGAFEAERTFVEDPDFLARFSEMGGRAVLAAPALAAGQAGGRAEAALGAELAGGWRFRVLDDPRPEAFLFADRSLVVSRGALAALSGEDALASLLHTAAAALAGGGFRDGGAGGRAGSGALVEQPLRLPLPKEALPPAGPSPAGASDGPVAEEGARDDWLDLLDGLPFGEPPEFGVAAGPEVLFPAGDVRLRLPDSGSFAGAGFEPDGRGVFRVVGSAGNPSGLTVRELPLPPDTTADLELDSGSFAGARRLVRGLAALLRARVEERGFEPSFVETFRVRGFTGARGRAHTPDGNLELAALLRAPDSLIEMTLDCGEERRFADCEARLLEFLGSADRLWDTPVPGPLRIVARAASGSRGSVREALRRWAADGGEADGSLAAVEFLNRAWLDEPVHPGDRMLVLSREPAASGSRAAEGGRDR